MAIVRLEGLGQLKIIHLIEIRTRDLPACSIVPQPTTIPRASVCHINLRNINAEVKNGEAILTALHLHSPIRLHGVVLNYLNTETTLPKY
jgi:hypothetical protein